VRQTIYAYPWDLKRMGVERAMQEIADAGIAAIDLAASYHPIDALSPRDGTNLFTSARGAVHFPARQERYGRIKPQVHSAEVASAWPEAARHADKMGIDLNAWTITLYQPWIRDAHPDCARVLPTGDRSGSGVCPANDDVREFLVTMCDDFVDQFGVRLVRLENIVPIFDFDWLRARILVTVPPLARSLLNLCFCGACTSKATAKGIDVGQLRKVVTAAVEAEIEEVGTTANENRAIELQADAELQAYADAFVRSSTALVQAIAAPIKGKARVSANLSASYTALIGAEQEEALMAEFISACDQVALHPGDPRNPHIAGISASANPPREISALIPLTGAGSAAPGRFGSAELRSKEVIDVGATELSLYNLGLVRERDIADFAATIAREYP
jgi:hypothetical protein